MTIHLTAYLTTTPRLASIDRTDDSNDDNNGDSNDDSAARYREMVVENDVFAEQVFTERVFAG